ncbi:hypothetical protein LTR53_005317 [Teratosphaeriaceae sp. CCFEE 6253]|nr:hypothetical protein LTR53_005317 [Teratosphaeriaceae sp. CCFEE 6253]
MISPHKVRVQLDTKPNSSLEHHCSLCHFLYASRAACEHLHHLRPDQRRPTASETSDSSFYTARTSDTFYSASSGSSTSTLTRKVSTRSPSRRPSLRRKISPTELSLRELRTRQSRQCLIRAKQSEEQLQRVYESQILAYLEGSFVGLDGVAD